MHLTGQIEPGEPLERGQVLTVAKMIRAEEQMIAAVNQELPAEIEIAGDGIVAAAATTER